MKFRISDECQSKIDIESFAVVKPSVLEVLREFLKPHNIRSFIALGVIAIAMLFFLGSAIHGLFLGHFGHLEAIATYAQGFIGLIIGYYFGVNHVEKEYKSSNGAD